MRIRIPEASVAVPVSPLLPTTDLYQSLFGGNVKHFLANLAYPERSFGSLLVNDHPVTLWAFHSARDLDFLIAIKAEPCLPVLRGNFDEGKGFPTAFGTDLYLVVYRHSNHNRLKRNGIVHKYRLLDNSQ